VREAALSARLVLSYSASLAFSLAWLYQDHAPLDGGAVLLELGSSGSQLPLEIQCCTPHRGHVLVHFPQCLVPLQEHLPHLRDRGGVFCSLGVLLHELVTHNFQPVLQPPVVGSQGFDESVQGVILVPVPVGRGGCTSPRLDSLAPITSGQGVEESKV
jgi:hypothetical protein